MEREGKRREGKGGEGKGEEGGERPYAPPVANFWLRHCPPLDTFGILILGALVTSAHYSTPVAYCKLVPVCGSVVT